MNHSIKACPGTYALILRAEESLDIQVGKLGKLHLIPGFYVYCGSARGPGGVKARVDRHLRRRKKRRWHIDYLSTAIPIVDVWYSYAEHWHECHWAESVITWAGDQVPFTGFGSSDCRCDAHLVRLQNQPGAAEFERRLSPQGVSREATIAHLLAGP